jgi:hypothetical protein
MAGTVADVSSAFIGHLPSLLSDEIERESLMKTDRSGNTHVCSATAGGFAEPDRI